MSALMTDLRPVLVGMQNPHGAEARHALYPLPRSSAGGRLYRMLAERVPTARMTDYARVFDRRNLCVGPFRADVARWVAATLHTEWQGSGRTVLLLGGAVRDAFALPPRLMHPTTVDGVRYRQLPHPSGRCLWYSDRTCRSLAALLLQELYEEVET